MAFPWLFEEGFEDGTRGAFNSETDTETRLDFPHYTTLASLTGLAMPFRGAYCMRVNLANDGTPADAYVQEDDGFDLALDGVEHVRFQLFVSTDITMADTDEFIILALQSAGPTNEAVVVINYTTANGLRIGVGETSGSQFLPLTTGVWHTVELAVTLDDGASNDGSLVLRLDDAAATTVSSLDQAAIAQARLGVVGQDAGTTKGYLLFDDVMVDDARLGPKVERFRQADYLTKSGHAFVGPGEITGISMIAGAATDNTVTIYDTDTGYTTDATNVVYAGGVEVASATRDLLLNEKIRVKRGAYVVLAGTNPRAQVRFRNPHSLGDGAMRTYAARRKPGPFTA